MGFIPNLPLGNLWIFSFHPGLLGNLAHMYSLISDYPNFSGIILTTAYSISRPNPILVVEYRDLFQSHTGTFFSHILGLLISLFPSIPSIFFSLVSSRPPNHTFHILTLINYVFFQSFDVQDFWNPNTFSIKELPLSWVPKINFETQNAKNRLLPFSWKFCFYCHHQKCYLEMWR